MIVGDQRALDRRPDRPVVPDHGVEPEQDGEAKAQTQIWLVVRCRVGRCGCALNWAGAWAAGLGIREGGRLLPDARAPDLLAYGLGWPTGAE